VTRPPTALPFLGGLLALYLIAPFGAGLMEIGRADWRSTDVAGLADACAISVASATLATALVAICGVPLGYLLARRPGRWMALLGFAVQLPLALPPLASGVLLLFLLGYASPLGRLTHGALTDSFIGVVLAEAFVAAPFLIIAARSAFAEIDPVLEDMAATLGHRPHAVFWRVSLSLAWRAILAGALLAWLRAFGEFGATVMVAYHPYSLPVYTYVAFGGQGLPAMLPVLLPTLVAAVLVMLASQIAGARRQPRKAARRRGAAVSETPLESAPPLLPVVGDRAFSFAFQRRVEGFDLEVAWRTNARRLAILGPSGSGKSMTLRLIAGLDDAQMGRLSVNGRDISAKPTYARGLAYVPQNYGLFPNLTIDEQIRFAVDHDLGLARHWTKRLGLEGLEQRRPAELSLGQQQRVALARCLARRADLLLLDEPFSALDSPLRARLRAELLDLQQDLDATTILVTHDPGEAAMLADELLLLNDGRVMQTGQVEEVFLRPVNETAARLLGADNIGYGRAVAHTQVDVGSGVALSVAGPPLIPGRRVGWSVRPEQVRVGPEGRYPATIQSVGELRAGQRALWVQFGEVSLRAVADSAGLREPGRCRIDIDPGAVQIWSLEA
jgi:molybdate transport system permease protein